MNKQLEQDFGGAARLQYIDFDGKELGEYPEVEQKVTAGELEPGVILVNGKLMPIWDMPYGKMIEEFEGMGAARISRKAS